MKHVDEEFLSNILTALTGQHGFFRIDRSVDEKGVLLNLYVAPDYLGLVIGKGGETAQALRTLLRTLGRRHNAFYSLLIHRLD